MALEERRWRPSLQEWCLAKKEGSREVEATGYL
jgi:hypothetical protein